MSNDTKFILLYLILKLKQLLLEQAVTSNKEKDSEIERLKTLLENRDAEIEEQNSKIRSHETERRKLHNQIQELKVRNFNHCVYYRDHCRIQLCHVPV